MKDKLFILSVVFLIWFMATEEKISAQESFDAEWISAIHLNDDLLQNKFFPAFSINKKFVVLIHQNYSCCISDDILFYLIGIGKEEVQESLLLYPSEDLETILTGKDKEKNLKRMQQILREGLYTPMIEIDINTVETKRDEATGSAEIRFLYAEHTYLVSKIPLKNWPAAYYCCGYMSKEEVEIPCENTPKIHFVWIDTKQEYALIQYGIRNQADGCDQGPKYFLTTIEQITTKKR